MPPNTLINGFNRNNLSYYAIVLLAFSLPFSIGLLPYFIGISFVAALFQDQLLSKIRGIHKHTPTMLLMGLFVLFCIGLLYTENMHSGSFAVQVRLSLLLLPFVVYVSRESLLSKLNSIHAGFIAGNVIASIVCLVKASINSFGNGAFNPFVKITRQSYTLTDVLFSGDSYFNYGYLSSLIHVNYFAVYLLLVLYLVYRKIARQNISGTYRIGYSILFIYLFIFFLMLQSRAAFIALAVITASEFIYQFTRHGYLKLKISVLAGSLLLLVAVVSFSGRISLLHSGKGMPTYSELKEKELRLTLWESAVPVIKENPIIGAGTGDADDEFKKNYQSTAIHEAHETNYNVHNEYIHTAMRLGIPAMLFLLYIVLYPVTKRQSHNRHRYILIFSLLILVSLTFESMFNRLNGVVFFALFYSLYSLCISNTNS